MLTAADIDRACRAIVSHHAELAVAASETLPTSPAPAAGAAVDDPVNDHVYRAAHMACVALGFIAADAQVVARAWQRQSVRLGRFDAEAWPCEAQDFGLSPWPREGACAPCPHALGLYAVLPDAAWVGRMARAGVPTVQLRFKSDDAEAVEREVQSAVKAVEGTGALLFINDHWQAAIRAGAYGVHLGQEDLDEADVAAVRAAGLRLGLSTHGYAEMLRADAFGPSYIALGAVFPTTLKRMATAPQGTGRLKRYARLLQARPLVAIGGIDAERLPEVMESGVGSAAMVRALVAAPDPERAAADLAEQVRSLSLARS